MLETIIELNPQAISSYEEAQLYVADLCERAEAYTNQEREAIQDLCEEAIAIAVAWQDTQGQARALLCLGYVFHDTSSFEKAISCALEIHALCDEGLQAAEASFLLALAHNRLHKQDEAYKYFEEAQAFYKAYGHSVKEADCLHGFGVIHYDQGRFEDAISLAKQSHELMESAKHVMGQVKALTLLGNSHERMGDYATALEYHFDALHLVVEDDQPIRLAYIYNNIANVYLPLKDIDQAIVYNQKSLAIKEELGDLWGIGSSHGNLAACYFASKDFLKANHHYKESRLIASEINDEEGVAIAHIGLGHIHLEEKQYEDAEKNLCQALSISEKIGDAYNHCHSFVLLAKLACQQGQYEQALIYLADAEALAEERQMQQHLVEIWRTYADCYELQADYPAALKALKTAHKIEKQVFSEQAESRRQSLDIRYRTSIAEQEKEIYQLKNVQLVEANKQLYTLNDLLSQANEQQQTLLTKLERQSYEDDLTGLYNRRFFDSEFQASFNHAKTKGHALTVVLADIDYFKRINDQYSHQLGDETLVTLAGLLRQHLREHDVVARYGGEEFALFFPNTSLAKTKVLCERIRLTIANYAWHTLAEGLTVTISLGLCDDTSVSSFEKMLSLADERLYEAKRNGRNQLAC